MTTVDARQSGAEYWDRMHLQSKGTVPVGRLESWLFQHHVRVEPGMRAVDIGCGTGPWTRELVRLGLHVTGYDISPIAIARAALDSQGKPWPRYDVWDVNSTDIPQHLAPRSFDIVTCRMTIAFLDRQRFLSDVARWLTPQGVVHLVTPVREKLRTPGRRRALSEQDVEFLGTGWRNVYRYNVTSSGSITAVILQHPK
ncbi:class I SAM-dependent methyltransferase [Streptomyces sp. MBT27]|uniref:class I SAM-dependent methyltransferase n=1 Tax=Streptomyces sp. MBT27 TaxID=1488356 RepID=UPI0014213071|nr:class I SAM-dependent methyltransferase [Streptomyces sp. MBT27]